MTGRRPCREFWDEVLGRPTKILAPMVGLSAGDEPDYLDYDIKGRGFFEKMFWHCGASYLLGMGAGGVYGASVGLRQAPSPLMRVRVNAVMNGCSKFGSRAGNGFGVLALYYTTAEQLVNMSGLEEYHDGGVVVNQALAGFISGCLYKGTKRPTTIALAGVLGGGLITASSMAEVFWMTNGSRFF